MQVDKNYIISNENLLLNDKTLFFNDEEVIYLEKDKDMFDILVMAGIFKSKSDARKNWKRTGRDIPKGFNQFSNIGKLKHKITIFNPESKE